MTLFDVTKLSLESAIRGSAMRQTTLSANVANANTPGYRRQDVDFQSALQAAWDQGKGGVERVQPSVGTDPSSAIRQDGSSVDIDVEAGAQAKNGLQYEAVAQVIKSRIAILRSAMGVQ